MNAKFVELKIILYEPPKLAYPNFDKPFIVEIDASLFEVAAALAKKDGKGKTHPIQFANRTMKTT